MDGSSSESMDWKSDWEELSGLIKNVLGDGFGDFFDRFSDRPFISSPRPGRSPSDGKGEQRGRRLDIDHFAHYLGLAASIPEKLQGHAMKATPSRKPGDPPPQEKVSHGRLIGWDNDGPKVPPPPQFFLYFRGHRSSQILGEGFGKAGGHPGIRNKVLNDDGSILGLKKIAPDSHVGYLGGTGKVEEGQDRPGDENFFGGLEILKVTHS